MIYADSAKLERPTADGCDTRMHVEVQCPTMRDALHEYAYITSRIRDMMYENGDGEISEEDAKAAIFSAYRIGMERIPYSEKAEIAREKLGLR